MLRKSSTSGLNPEIVAVRATLHQSPNRNTAKVPAATVGGFSHRGRLCSRRARSARRAARQDHGYPKDLAMIAKRQGAQRWCMNIRDPCAQRQRRMQWKPCRRARVSSTSAREGALCPFQHEHPSRNGGGGAAGEPFVDSAEPAKVGRKEDAAEHGANRTAHFSVRA